MPVSSAMAVKTNNGYLIRISKTNTKGIFKVSTNDNETYEYLKGFFGSLYGDKKELETKLISFSNFYNLALGKIGYKNGLSEFIEEGDYKICLAME